MLGQERHLDIELIDMVLDGFQSRVGRVWLFGRVCLLGCIAFPESAR